jgi:hypothetical protein
VEGIGNGGWVCNAVGEAEVDSAKARGVGITQPGSLQRRWSASEDQQTVPRHVAAGVNKQIEGVAAYEVGGFVVAECVDVTPAIPRDRAEVCGAGIGAGDVAVAEDFELRGGVVAEDGKQCVSSSMTAEFRGNVADAEAYTFWDWRVRLAEALGEHALKSPVFVPMLDRSQLASVVGVQQVRGMIGAVGASFEERLEQGHGLGRPSCEGESRCAQAVGGWPGDVGEANKGGLGIPCFVVGSCSQQSESRTEAFVIRTDTASAFDKAKRPCRVALTGGEKPDFEQRFWLTSPGAEAVA